MGHVDRIGTGTVVAASATGTITLGAGKAAAVGQTVIVGVVWESGSGTIPPISGATDSRGNTYTLDEDAGGSGNTTVALSIVRGRVTTALTAGDTITVTISGGTRSRWSLVAETFDDVAASSPLDQHTSNDNPGNSGSLVTGATPTTTQATELVVAFFGFGSGRSVTIPAGWDGGAKVETSAGSTDRAGQLIWKYVTSTGAQQGTLTVSPSSTYAGAIATYKLASEAHSGSGAITGALAMSATGSPAVDGSGELTGNLAISASGRPDIGGGAGSIAGQLAMSASGTAETGIGRPPRPRTRWQLILGPATGGHELALTEAKARRYTVRLKDNSDLGFSIDGRHPQAAEIEELSTDVHLLFSTADGTQILDRCRVGNTGDQIDQDRHVTQVSCLDYRAVLDRRILWTGDTLTFAGVDQADIAWELIERTQAHRSGYLGISKGFPDGSTGVPRDRTYEVGDSIGQRIQELSEVIGGFDWDILPVSASGLALQTWYPQRGSDRGVVLILGGLASSISREVDTSDYANALRYTGARGDDVTPGPDPVEWEAGDLDTPGTIPQGRWDAVFGDDGLKNQSALEDRAEWQSWWSEVIRPTYTVRLIRGGWGGPDHIWVGDTVRLIVPSGRLEVDTTARVYEIQIDMDEEGGEAVTLTLGGPKPDYRRWPSAIEKRLRNLERR